jgi:hypothetical protein
LQWTFKAKTINIDDITLPAIASTICKNSSTFCMQKLNNSSAKEPIITQYANKRATWMLGTIKKQISSQLSKTNASISVPTIKEVTASNSLMSRLLTALQMAGKPKPASFHQRKRIPHHNQAFPVLKTHKIPHQVERLRKLGVLK